MDTNQTLHLAVENFGGITSATIQIKPGITLLSGGNGASKTTVLRAIAACCRPDAVIPIEGLLKKDSRLLVRGKTGSATLTGPGGERRVVWPSNGAKGAGPFTPPPSRIALGLVDWTMTHPTDRIKILQETAALDPSLAPTVTRDDLDQAVKGHGIDATVIDWAWEIVTNPKGGMDAAYTIVGKAYTEATGAWRAITGETYGAVKAQSYIPQGWDPSIATATLEGLSQAIADASAQVDQAIANQAVDSSIVAQVTELANAEIPDLLPLEVAVSEAKFEREPHVQKFRDALNQLDNELETDVSVDIKTWSQRLLEVRAEIQQIQSGASRIDGVCPGCGISLTISRVGENYEVSVPSQGTDLSKIPALKAELENLRKSIKLSQDMKTARADEKAAKKADLQRSLFAEEATAREAHAKALKQLDMAKARKETIKAAQLRLADLQGKSGGSTVDQIKTLREKLRRAEAQKNAFETKTKADGYALGIKHYAALKDILEPGGLRLQKMRGTIEEYNARLAALSSVAGWHVVSINADGDVFYDGLPVVICSRAEQLRCRVTVQVMLAVVEKSPILLIDDVDTLDSDGRQGLISVLKHVGITSVIALMAKRDYANVIAQIFDSAFWIENGVVTGLDVAA